MPDRRVAYADGDRTCVEHLVAPAGARRLACAPHAGKIEPGTGAQARRFRNAADRAASWVFAGYREGGGAYDAWHVRSGAVRPERFELLDRVFDRGFRRAVSFHGFEHEGVLVGGGAPPAVRRGVATVVRDRLTDAVPVRAVPPGGRGPYAGTSPANFVNRVAAAGLQLEQGLAVREEHGGAVAVAVADALGEP